MSRLVVVALLLMSTVLGRMSLAGTVVRFESNLGSFDINLFDETAPNTVANFLSYVQRGDYTNSIVHRSVPEFVIQGGGYYSDFSQVVEGPTVANEFGATNARGTIGMAKLGGNPDSATSQWFINLGDNGFLDAQNGGFTVFGEVAGDGMAVVDSIAALDRDMSNTNGPFLTEVPVLDVSLPVEQRRLPDNLVVFQRVTIVPEPSSLLLACGLFALPFWRRAVPMRVAGLRDQH